MAGEHTIEWLNKLIERGEDVGQCLVLLREISEREEKAAEERAAERKNRSKERGRELKMKELEIREKELSLRKTETRDSTGHDTKVEIKLPNFTEGQYIEVYQTSF